MNHRQYSGIRVPGTDITSLPPRTIYYTARLDEPSYWISENIQARAGAFGAEPSPEAALALVPPRYSISHVEKWVVCSRQPGIFGNQHRLLEKLAT